MDAQEPDWEGMIAAVRNGRSEAFRHLFDASYREVRLFVAARAASVEMIDEVVQSAYVTAYEALDTFHANASFTAWMKGIARNLLRQEYARRGRLVPMTVQEQTDDDDHAVPNDLGQRMDSCLEKLSPSARQLVELRYRERIPVQDIATRLQRTPSSVSVSLHRIRTVLAECLGPEVMVHV